MRADNPDPRPGAPELGDAAETGAEGPEVEGSDAVAAVPVRVPVPVDAPVRVDAFADGSADVAVDVAVDVDVEVGVEVGVMAFPLGRADPDGRRPPGGYRRSPGRKKFVWRTRRATSA